MYFGISNSSFALCWSEIRVNSWMTNQYFIEKSVKLLIVIGWNENAYLALYAYDYLSYTIIIRTTWTATFHTFECDEINDSAMNFTFHALICIFDTLRLMFSIDSFYFICLRCIQGKSPHYYYQLTLDLKNWILQLIVLRIEIHALSFVIA